MKGSSTRDGVCESVHDGLDGGADDGAYQASMSHGTMTGIGTQP